jgi:hypothetical protein
VRVQRPPPRPGRTLVRMTDPDDDTDDEDTPLYVPAELVDVHYVEGDHESNPADRTGLG